jgi:hypothetical protein
MNAFCFPRLLGLLLVLGCSGANGLTEAVGAGGAPSAEPIPIVSGASAVSCSAQVAGGGGNSIGSGGTQNPSAGTAGALPQGGAGDTEAGSPSGGAPETAGAPSAGHGGSGGAAAGAAGSAPVCVPKSFAAACGARACGKAADGCGAEYGCGTCPGLTECTDAGVCATTCHALALECGSHPAHELECGSCPDGQDCGVVGVGKCSTCAEAPNAGGVCPAARPHLWKPCGGAPEPECRKPYDQDPSWWCCP